jgi:hypothetical protein
MLLTKSDDPYDALGYLAEHLGINEGLSLNTAKTSVMRRGEYVRWLERLTSDIEEEAEGVALDAITADLYFDEVPDEEDLEKLKELNLVEFLTQEIEQQNWDMGRIKVIFRALKIAKPKEIIDFIKSRFGKMVVFAKEMCLLMEVMEKENLCCFNDILNDVLLAILTPPASSVQLIRTWLLEIFVRGVIELPLIDLKRIESLPAINDKRQLLLIRGRGDDKNYFRKQSNPVREGFFLIRPNKVICKRLMKSSRAASDASPDRLMTDKRTRLGSELKKRSFGSRTGRSALSNGLVATAA